MALFPFKTAAKGCLGIDIGTSTIKVVELIPRGERVKLEKYGEISIQTLYEKPFRTFEKSTLLLSSQDISRAIQAIIEEAKISERKAIFSIPDFASFFTNFELPSMTKEELPDAIRFEARHHIPLPLSEVTLDWSIIEGEVDQRKIPLKILLVAVPNEVISQYQKIASLAKLELKALEAEVFGLTRSLIKEDPRVIALLDFGAQSSTISLIDKGVLKISHSFDVSGNELTQLLAKSLNIDYWQAENLKRKYGLNLPDKEASSIALKIRDILIPLVDLILLEIEKISLNFFQKEKKGVQKIILAGGLALLPGLKDYFLKNLKKEVEIANPFLDLMYPPILDETLKEMGPAYAIAVGMALRGLK